ncbi:hypothetical protein HZB02_05780 [Candidatus Woesearchaeota archaeon]|nr:hypothetical protein [Candidatus Woesearchaeota archaeon]
MSPYNQTRHELIEQEASVMFASLAYDGIRNRIQRHYEENPMAFGSGDVLKDLEPKNREDRIDMMMEFSFLASYIRAAFREVMEQAQQKKVAPENQELYGLLVGVYQGFKKPEIYTQLGTSPERVRDGFRSSLDFMITNMASYIGRDIFSFQEPAAGIQLTGMCYSPVFERMKPNEQGSTVHSQDMENLRYHVFNWWDDDGKLLDAWTNTHTHLGNFLHQTEIAHHSMDTVRAFVGQPFSKLMKNHDQSPEIAAYCQKLGELATYVSERMISPFYHPLPRGKKDYSATVIIAQKLPEWVNGNGS